MSSMPQAMNSRINEGKLNNKCFCCICTPQGDTNMAALYNVYKLGYNAFSEYLAYEISHIPDSWQGFLYISSCLFSFPRFWTFRIDWIASSLY